MRRAWTYGQWVALVLAGILLGGCGGGGSSGGFTSTGVPPPQPIRVTITADRTSLPANVITDPAAAALSAPTIGGLFTTTLTVRAEDPGGNPIPNGTEIQFAITQGLEQGALFFLDGDPEHEDDDGNPLAFRSGVVESTSGVGTMHFHASGTPGTAVVTATIFDTNVNRNVTASVQITVGGGASTSRAGEIRFLFSPSPLYITGQGQADVTEITAAVLDDAGEPVPDPVANNVRFELLSGRPNGGERLSAAGTTQEGATVQTRTINGLARVFLHTGSLPGTVRILAVADRSDGDVDNGIQSAVSDVTSVPVGSGEVVSLQFTGPFASAVFARVNVLGITGNDLVVDPTTDVPCDGAPVPGNRAGCFANGVYQRFITVLATDQFGNPPPPGTPITFRLIDSPLSGYPDQGHGVFDIAGDDGNPDEGGSVFRTPDGGSSFAGTVPLRCQLVMEGRSPDQVGGRIISGVSGLHTLSVTTPFNTSPFGDTGFTVPYTVGCTPHVGNVENAPDGVTVQTDDSGVAETILNYPASQLGRRFKLVAEANGGKAGAVLSHYYLGVPGNSALFKVAPAQEFVPVVGSLSSQVVTLQLLDGTQSPPTPLAPQLPSIAPLPGERIAVEIIISDPARDDALAKRDAADAAAAVAPTLAEAEGTAAALGASCPIGDAAADPPVAGVQCSCATIDAYNADDPVAASEASTGCAGAATRAEAEADADVAEALAALHTPQACATENLAVDSVDAPECQPPIVLITDSQGMVQAKLLVDDLPGDGSVQFLFTTVGPEILVDTLTVTAQPAGTTTPATSTTP